VLGSPTTKQVMDMAPNYKDKDFPQFKAPPLDTHFLPGTDD